MRSFCRSLGGIVSLVLLFSFVGTAQPQIDSAKKYLYVREKASNRSPEIDRWNKFVGNALGSPYCAAYASSMSRTQTSLKAGLATRLITKRSISAQEALRGVPVPSGSYVIWRRGATIFGHAGLVIWWSKSHGKTIEGNTSSGEAGSQSDGDGVFIRMRKIEPFSAFKIVAFTPIP